MSKALRISEAIQQNSDYPLLREEYEAEGLPFDTHLQQAVIDLLDGGSFSGQSIATCVVLLVQIMKDILHLHRERKRTKPFIP